LGINKNISEERKKASAIAIQYITSQECQRKYVIENFQPTLLMTLYDDEEVCKRVNCELLKKMQFISRPSSIYKDYDEYSSRFRNYIYDFFLEGKDAAYTLEKIDDIVKIYNMSYDSSSSKEGFIMMIITIVLFVIMTLSLVFLFIKKFKSSFEFFSIELWIIIFIGFYLNLSSIFTHYGNVTTTKCQIQVILNNFGFTFLFVPILYRLFTNFHDKNKFIMWIEKRKHLFILIFIFFDILMSGLTFNPMYDIKTIEINEGKNFQICSIRNYGKVIMSIIFSEKIIIIFMILLLIFLEWNVVRFSRDIKAITSLIYINCLIAIILVIFNGLDIKNYKTQFMLNTTVILLSVFSSYFFLYVIRIILMKKKDEPKLKLLKPVIVSSSNATENGTVSCKSKYEKSIDKSGYLFGKILKHHYYTGEEDKGETIISIVSVPTVNSNIDSNND